MEAISPQELMDLLNSKDHAGVIDRKDGPIFDQEELDQLLDRSALSWEKLAKANNKENQTVSNSKNNKNNKNAKNAKKSSGKSQPEFFKVVDTEGMQDNVLQSVGNKYNNQN